MIRRCDLDDVDDLAQLNRASLSADYNRPNECYRRHQHWLDLQAQRKSRYRTSHGWPVQ